ncbi:hypothetical protein KP509_1Z275000 [Ceratopteris richardii]|nr:hypothetical protein KP509_1Z275000 [Ceratopteris richardii]
MYSKPLQAKHLEVARMGILGVAIDFVNLRTDDYAKITSSPFEMQGFGTVMEDAHRRDLTINRYNLLLFLKIYRLNNMRYFKTINV